MTDRAVRWSLSSVDYADQRDKWFLLQYSAVWQSYCYLSTWIPPASANLALTGESLTWRNVTYVEKATFLWNRYAWLTF